MDEITFRGASQIVQTVDTRRCELGNGVDSLMLTVRSFPALDSSTVRNMQFSMEMTQHCLQNANENEEIADS